MPAHDAHGAAHAGRHGEARWQDTLLDVLRVCEVDAVTASTVDAVLFADDGEPPTITPDEAAVLVEALKDLFYQSYVRTAKLRAAHEDAALLRRREHAARSRRSTATAGASSPEPTRRAQFGAVRPFEYETLPVASTMIVS